MEDFMKGLEIAYKNGLMSLDDIKKSIKQYVREHYGIEL